MSGGEMEDPATFTPAYLLRIGGRLSVGCAKCKVLREILLDGLCVAGRGNQPISQMKFRCDVCGTPGEASISWGDWGYDVAKGEVRDRRSPNIYARPGER